MTWRGPIESDKKLAIRYESRVSSVSVSVFVAETQSSILIQA